MEKENLTESEISTSIMAMYHRMRTLLDELNKIADIVIMLADDVEVKEDRLNGGGIDG